jgi:hypothetical protein
MIALILCLSLWLAAIVLLLSYLIPAWVIVLLIAALLPLFALGWVINNLDGWCHTLTSRISRRGRAQRKADAAARAAALWNSASFIDDCPAAGAVQPHPVHQTEPRSDAMRGRRMHR